MRVVTGSNAETEVEAILQEFQDMNEAWAEQGITDHGLTFFDNGVSMLLPPSHRPLITFKD